MNELEAHFLKALLEDKVLNTTPTQNYNRRKMALGILKKLGA